MIARTHATTRETGSDTGTRTWTYRDATTEVSTGLCANMCACSPIPISHCLNMSLIFVLVCCNEVLRCLRKSPPLLLSKNFDAHLRQRWLLLLQAAATLSLESGIKPTPPSKNRNSERKDMSLSLVVSSHTCILIACIEPMRISKIVCSERRDVSLSLPCTPPHMHSHRVHRAHANIKNRLQ